MRPEACALFSTEFDGSRLNLDFDIIVGYRLLPLVGRAHLEFFPAFPKSLHGIIIIPHLLTTLGQAGDQSFRSHLFADDGILSEPDFPDRLIQGASTWEFGSFMVSGMMS